MKVVLVRAGENSSGIGAAVVKAFASQSARVLIYFFQQEIFFLSSSETQRNERSQSNH